MFEIENGVLLYCDEEVSNLIIPNTVKVIGSRALSELNFESIILPETVTEIEEYAFASCKMLERVHIPNSVKVIAANAFSYCESLQEVILPIRLTVINQGTFNSCKALEYIELPAGITTIGEKAFSFCEALQSISLPDSICAIEPYAFHYCTALKQIDLPFGIETIEKGCFEGCRALSAVTIPESIHTIKENAFTACRFERIALPPSLKTLEERAFSGCKNLTTIYVPENLEECTNAFWLCNNLINFENIENSKYFSVRDNALCNKDGSILIRCNPDVTDEYTVADCIREIAPYAFYSLEQLKVVNLPDHCVVKENAFSRCWNLRQENGFVIVGDNLIMYCGEDTAVVIPANIKYIGENAFSECESLREVTFPKGLISIGTNAFAFCTSLLNVEIPYHTKSLGAGAFYECSSLQTVSVPGSIKVIPKECFSCCTSLKRVALHEGLIEIMDSAFSGCESLHELKVPYGTKVLGEITNSTGQLSRLYIPETVTEISKHAFMIDNLELYVQNNSFAKWFGQQGANSSYVVAIKDVPASVFNAKETVPDPFVIDGSELIAFLGISETTVVIPDGVKTIRSNAFAKNNIERVIVPNSVIEIGKYAFYACDKLREIVVLGDKITIDDGAFAGCFDLQRIIIFSTDITFSETIFRSRSLSAAVENDHFCFCCPPNSPVIQYALSQNKNYAIIAAELVNSNVDNIISACNSCAIIPVAALSIRGDMLNECCWTKLQENADLKLPDTIVYIADGAFKKSGHIFNIALPNRLKTIGKEAFKQSRVQKITMSKSVEDIGEAAFEESGIQEIALPEIQQLAPRTFYKCYDLKHVELPESLLKIGADAFSHCLELKGISLPKRLIEIGERAFDQCNNLLYIIIPDSVVEIADNAFSGCFECVYLCSRGSAAWEYMEKHHLPVYTYSDEIVANIHRREELKANNKSLNFNYQGNSITIPSNYAIYHKLLKYYTPKADEIHCEFIKLCEKLVHDSPASISEQFFAMLEKLAETAERDLQSVGIYLQNAKGRLYYANPALQAMFPIMTAVFEAVLELYQNTLNKVELQKNILLAQAESKVTGVGYGIITSSAVTYAAYAFDDYFERVKQRKSAAQQLKVDLDSLTKEKINELEMQCNQFVKQAVEPTMRALIERFVEELFGMVVFYLELHKILPENIQRMFDHSKAGKLLTSDLLTSYQKGTILGKALAYCPYNLDVYNHIIDLGFENDTVYQIAACVGIEKEVSALQSKINTEKQRRRVIEEQRRQDEERRRLEEEQRRQAEERRRREEALAEKQRKEAEAREQSRAERKRQLEEQIRLLETELSNLKGFFTGKRKATIRQKIEELEIELKNV